MSALVCWQHLGIQPPEIAEPYPILSLPILAKACCETSHFRFGPGKLEISLGKRALPITCAAGLASSLASHPRSTARCRRPSVVQPWWTNILGSPKRIVGSKRLEWASPTADRFSARCQQGWGRGSNRFSPPANRSVPTGMQVVNQAGWVRKTQQQTYDSHPGDDQT